MRNVVRVRAKQRKVDDSNAGERLRRLISELDWEIHGRGVELNAFWFNRQIR